MIAIVTPVDVLGRMKTMGKKWSKFIDKVEKAEAKLDKKVHARPNTRCTWWCGDVECPAKCPNK